jgi:APA family basic amino acid/polyamine antiporter
LGLIDATSLVVVGLMIGSGFIVTAAMARDIGSAAWLLIIWLVTV